MLFPTSAGSMQFDNQINNDSKVSTIQQLQRADFDRFLQQLLQEGYEKKEEATRPGVYFAALQKADEALFLNYYENIQEMTLVTEPHSRYFDYRDQQGPAIVSSQITQIALEDFGMSYVIRLSDGRFIVIDGGRHFAPDAQKLYDCLKAGTDREKPVIAAWIMTHPHADHYLCYITFMEMFAQDVVIEKYLLTFPEHDDLAHYPKLAKTNKIFGDVSGCTNIPKMFQLMQQSDAPIYAPHTGQTYQIGNARCEILGSMDDTIHLSSNINATSLVIRMELEGQVILWGTDACFSELRLAEKFGSSLQAHILQVPHHGFQAGSAQGEIDAYVLIQPKVCMMPVSDFDAYTIFCTYREATRFLMQDAGVEEMITGDVQKTLTLPYQPAPGGKNELARKFLAGRQAAGSNTWVFSDLHTSQKEHFDFSVLNMTNFPVDVWIELFFEDPGKTVRFMKAKIPKLSLKQLCIIGDDVDPDALYFNSNSLKQQGIVPDAPFAVRFTCSAPIVVSHKTCPCSYHA